MLKLSKTIVDPKSIRNYAVVTEFEKAKLLNTDKLGFE
jgi:hypothetical protein